MLLLEVDADKFGPLGPDVPNRLGVAIAFSLYGRSTLHSNTKQNIRQKEFHKILIRFFIMRGIAIYIFFL